jgi:hypothetical protein
MSEWALQLQAALNAVFTRSVAPNGVQHAAQDYITTANKKSGVFRDVIVEADYNPMQYAAQNIRVPTHDVSDPVKVDSNKAQHEAALVRAS